MVNPRVDAWEERLNRALRAADRELERRFGGALPIHPARPPAGAAVNPQQDGLFRVTAAFTAGFGSSLGRGYALDIGIASLADVPPELRARIEAEAIPLIAAGLRRAFPGKDLRIERDGAVWKIIGDLSLS